MIYYSIVYRSVVRETRYADDSVPVLRARSGSLLGGWQSWLREYSYPDPCPQEFDKVLQPSTLYPFITRTCSTNYERGGALSRWSASSSLLRFLVSKQV